MSSQRLEGGLMKSAFRTLLFAGLFSTAAVAQMPSVTQPGPQHKRLEALAGNWDVAVRFRYGNGPERQSTARGTAEWILDGHYLQQNYKNDSGLAVLQILGYDNQKKKFFEVKFDT